MKLTATTEIFAMIAVVSLLALHMGCQTMRPNTAAGGLFGSATGGLLGAAIGAHDGKAKEGALLGALAGGTAGALLGNRTDERNAREDQRYLDQQQRVLQAAVSMDQVVQMTRSGLSEELIANQIQMNGIVAQPTTNDLIQLKSNGVSDRVIQSLQTAPLAGERNSVQPFPPVYVQQPEVIFAEPYCGPPMFYGPNPYPYRHHPAHLHRGSQVGFSIGF